MPYITREDGVRFVIPSYRDVLSAKKKGLLKKEVMLLSTNYGEYISLRRKDAIRYEIAFSPDAGYLLGESVWHYFKRPTDMVYCEAIPNTNEAILVIVKGGSVHLDGNFPLESIPEELVIFRTQQNNFDIYVYGDVPISQVPEEGKFTFDASSVKSFNVLEQPVFPAIPLVKTFQLQLVDTVLKAQGIGVLPIKPMLIAGTVLFLLWFGFDYLSKHEKVLPSVVVGVVNPYQLYLNTLTSPAPNEEIGLLIKVIGLLYTMPGWIPQGLEYSHGELNVAIISDGMKVNTLLAWARRHGVFVNITSDGFFLDMSIPVINRPAPTTIHVSNEVIAAVIDRVSYVLPGNVLAVSDPAAHGIFKQTTITIKFNQISPAVLDLLAQQFKGLPLILNKVSLKLEEGNLSGTIIIDALGS